MNHLTLVLFFTSAVLGLLAFFEPCTIATHTLFAVRTNRDLPRQRWVALFQLLASRTFLLATLFGGAAWIGLSTIPPFQALIMLVVMGTVYLITRKFYLPVPHLEFFRLLPGHANISQGLKLGLTLPACTIPLVIVLVLISALTQQPATAQLAGIIFAVMFSLPTLWNSVHGLSAAQRNFLGIAAVFTPYLTTLFLWSGALFIWNKGV